MKLLFDHNLSPNLVRRLSDLFPDSNHVYFLNLDHSSDRKIHLFAKENDFVIVTRDADYSDLNLILGYPPKVIWIRRGNCSTDEIAKIIRANITQIEMLFSDPSLGILTIF